MNHEKARSFWNTVLLHADVLRAPLEAEPATPDWELAVEKATEPHCERPRPEAAIR